MRSFIANGCERTRISVWLACATVNALVVGAGCSNRKKLSSRKTEAPLVSTPQWVLDASAMVPTTVKALATSKLAPTEHVVHAVGKRVGGDQLQRIVTFDAAAHKMRKLTLDAGGSVVDYEQLIKSARAQYTATYGAMTKALHTDVTATPNDMHEVVVTYATPPSPPLRSLGAAVPAALEKTIAPSRAKMLKLLNQLGAKDVSGPTTAPVLRAKLNGAVLANTLAHNPEVRGIKRHRTDAKLLAAASTADLRDRVRPLRRLL